MKLMVIRTALLSFAISLWSCNDIFREDEQRIQGNIAVINPGNEEDKGYKLVFHEREFNANIIEDYVVAIYKNDSVMAVNGVSKKSCEPTFFKINHSSGESVSKVEEINNEAYERLITQSNLKEVFETRSDFCQ